MFALSVAPEVDVTDLPVVAYQPQSGKGKGKGLGMTKRQKKRAPKARAPAAKKRKVRYISTPAVAVPRRSRVSERHVATVALASNYVHTRMHPVSTAETTPLATENTQKIATNKQMTTSTYNCAFTPDVGSPNTPSGLWFGVRPKLLLPAGPDSSVNYTQGVTTVPGLNPVAPLCLPMPFHTGGTALGATESNSVDQQAYPTSSDYVNLAAMDRTEGCGFKISTQGLPSNISRPDGVAYCIMLQDDEIQPLLSAGFTASNNTVPSGTVFDQAVCEQLVNDGKANKFTIQELDKADFELGYLPLGDNEKFYTETNVRPYSPTTSPPTTLDGRLGAPGMVIFIIFSPVISTTPAASQTFVVDFAHHLSYVPTVAAASIITTRQMPNSSNVAELSADALDIAMDKIAGATSLAQIRDLRPERQPGLACTLSAFEPPGDWDPFDMRELGTSASLHTNHEVGGGIFSSLWNAIKLPFRAVGAFMKTPVGKAITKPLVEHGMGLLDKFAPGAGRFVGEMAARQAPQLF